ncbi:hypothetical protein CFN17_10385 [Arthrobacter sp. PM3]|nr:hypothetical protein CFN17_10385 [Arthrobacter sp. PM3]
MIILDHFARTGFARDRVTGTAGLILGITGTVICLVVTAITAYGMDQYTEKIRNFPFPVTTQGSAASAGPKDLLPNCILTFMRPLFRRRSSELFQSVP